MKEQDFPFLFSFNVTSFYIFLKDQHFSISINCKVRTIETSKQRLTRWVQWVTHLERQSFTNIVHIFLQDIKSMASRGGNEGREEGREGCSALDASFLMRSHLHDKVICKSCAAKKPCIYLLCNILHISNHFYPNGFIQIKCCGSKTAL